MADTRLTALFVDISNKIREKGVSGNFTPDQMPDAIRQIMSTPPIEMPDYLCFTAEEANSTIAMAKVGSPSTLLYLETSTDGMDFTSWDPLTQTKTLANIGDKLYVRGNNTSMATSPTAYYKFVMTGKIASSGNINSLLNEETFDYITTLIGRTYCYCQLFYECASLTTAPRLPATTLTGYCYYSMFKNCTSLTTAPILPATNIISYCYQQMFQGCTNLNMMTVSFTKFPTFPFYMSNWVQGVAATGEFHCPSALPTTARGPSRVPVGWTVINDVE